ncbi:MAG: histidinol-phosphatase HisJ family protein [Firmicutes bacterium]|nr:histidinol-phosphatase HisJ family protein [Bacillota bacterium]
MARVDYHLHTCYSMDCDMTLDALCSAALAAGLDEICITDHTEFGHPAPGSDQLPEIEKWLADIERCREQYAGLVIRAGIEIGDNPRCREQIKAWHFALPLDFRLLSLHLIDNEDPYFPGFFADKEQDAVYRRYVEAKLESALAWSPDEYEAMAHLGYCAKFAPYPARESPLRYLHAPDAFDALFTRLAEGGKALEINTSGRKTMNEFFPDQELLTRFHELGGEFVTIGSDAHSPEYVGKWVDDAQELAKACGFRYMLTFEQRRAIPILL